MEPVGSLINTWTPHRPRAVLVSCHGPVCCLQLPGSPALSRPRTPTPGLQGGLGGPRGSTRAPRWGAAAASRAAPALRGKVRSRVDGRAARPPPPRREPSVPARTHTQSFPCEPEARPDLRGAFRLWTLFSVNYFYVLIAGRLGVAQGSGERDWPRVPAHVATDSSAPHPFPNAGPRGRQEAAWELSEEVFPHSRSFILG